MTNVKIQSPNECQNPKQKRLSRKHPPTLKLWRTGESSKARDMKAINKALEKTSLMTNAKIQNRSKKYHESTKERKHEIRRFYESC